MILPISSIPGICFMIMMLSYVDMNEVNSFQHTRSEAAMTNQAPNVVIERDDHVATIEMDFSESNSYALWNVGDDGLDPVGYRVQWWPDPAVVNQLVTECGCATDLTTGDTIIATPAQPHQLVTAQTVIQIQPIANNVLYHLKVEKLNSFGQVCSPATELTFLGGDPSRVNDLRNSMTFFDDFNLPMGPADERNWNHAKTPQADPRFSLFFINHQCHSHTLTGTWNGAAGDKAQVAQRPRKPILIDSIDERRIVFDMDGIFSPRSVWYLDLNPIKTDLTGHMSFFDSDGEEGLPSDVLRLRAQGNEISVHLINSQGASYGVASANLAEHGRKLATNVRRAFDIRLNTQGIKMYVDGTLVIDEDFDPGAFKPGIYNLLWSTIGYNTSKDDNPYFLSHWDNFGFDGPDIEPYVVHNYVTRIDSTDHQKSSDYSDHYPIFRIDVPDDIRPLQSGDTNSVWLVFTYMQNDFSAFSVEPDDSVFVNGLPYQLPQGINNSSPTNPDLTYHWGSNMSNRIHIGDAYYDGTSPLLIGENNIQFFATNTGIMNVHLEVICPEGPAAPPYTQPAEIHHFPLHSQLPILGIPARIIDVNNVAISSDDNGNLYGPQVTGEVPIEFLIGNRSWAGWAPHLLHMPPQSAELWSTGGTKGVNEIDLFIKPAGDTISPALLFTSIITNHDAPAPQIRYAYPFDSRKIANGIYEIFVQSKNAHEVKSHPAYHGFAFYWDASEISGAYYPVEIEVQNPSFAEYIFTGNIDSLWTNHSNWDTGISPPYFYNGLIKIQADCTLPSGERIILGLDAELVIEPNVTLIAQDE